MTEFEVLETFMGSPDGAHSYKYEKGQTVTDAELGASLTRVSLESKKIKLKRAPRKAAKKAASVADAQTSNEQQDADAE